MCNAIQVQDALKQLYTGTREDLRQSLNCRASTGTLSRILDGVPVGERQIRAVGRALGIHNDSPSTARRAWLRRECRERFGITLEQAALNWIEEEG